MQTCSKVENRSMNGRFEMKALFGLISVHFQAFSLNNRLFL